MSTASGDARKATNALFNGKRLKLGFFTREVKTAPGGSLTLIGDAARVNNTLKQLADCGIHGVVLIAHDLRTCWRAG